MKKIAIIIIVFIISFGCNDFLEPENVEDLTSASFWQNSSDARKGIVASYAALQSHTGSKWTFFEQLYIGVTWKADDVLNAPTDYGKSIADFTNGTDDGTFTSFWKANYAGISYANQVIENVPNIIAMTETERTEIVAEAKFLRALYHFHLLVAFENIPLITETPQVPADFYVSQNSAAEVWAQIEQDLKDAKAGMPDSRDSEDIGRATSWTASAYLGKIYLFQEKFTDAAAELTSVITSGPYDLLPNYSDNFNGNGENGVESVFEIQWSGDRANGNDERHPFNFEVTPGALGGWELYYPSDWLITEMMTDLTATSTVSDRVYGSVFFNDPNSEMVDVYTGASVAYSTVAGDLSHPKFFKKYTGEFDKSFYNGINIHLMRFADVLLMQAEALNEISAGNTDAATALVNRVRARSNAADIPVGSMDQAQLRQQIRHHERPVELAMEYTIRWFDLYRWAKGSTARELISGTLANHSKPFVSNYVDGTHDRFPVPLEELNKNENLIQNSGY